MTPSYGIKLFQFQFVDRMRCAGALNCILKDIRNTYDRYIYENCIVQLASVGLAQARPNYSYSTVLIQPSTQKPGCKASADTHCSVR